MDVENLLPAGAKEVRRKYYTEDQLIFRARCSCMRTMGIGFLFNVSFTSKQGNKNSTKEKCVRGSETTKDDR